MDSPQLEQTLAQFRSRGLLHLEHNTRGQTHSQQVPPNFLVTPPVFVPLLCVWGDHGPLLILDYIVYIGLFLSQTLAKKEGGDFL